MENRIWKSTFLMAFSDEEIINIWIALHQKDWFNNKENGFYGYGNKAREIAKYWLEHHHEHGPDYNDYHIIKIQNYWDEFIEMFEEEIKE